MVPRIGANGERTTLPSSALDRRRGKTTWSEPFLLADTPGFPDCNTCLLIDPHERLWLFWPTVLANTWESCLTNFRVSSDYAGPDAPQVVAAGP